MTDEGDEAKTEPPSISHRKIIYTKSITRQIVRANRQTTYYVFGDNMARIGYGG